MAKAQQDTLYGIAEIAHAMGVSRQTAHQAANKKDFPDPIAELAMGPVWAGDDVDLWARSKGRTLNSIKDMDRPKGQGNNKGPAYDPIKEAKKPIAKQKA